MSDLFFHQFGEHVCKLVVLFGVKVAVGAEGGFDVRVAESFLQQKDRHVHGVDDERCVGVAKVVDADFLDAAFFGSLASLRC